MYFLYRSPRRCVPGVGVWSEDHLSDQEDPGGGPQEAGHRSDTQPQETDQQGTAMSEIGFAVMWQIG